MKALFTALLIACLAVYSYQTPLSNVLLPAFTNAGYPTIWGEVERVNTNFNESVEAFVPINATCYVIGTTKREGCIQCATSKCQARLQQVCPLVPNLVGDVVDFAAGEVPKFVLNTVENVGREALNAVKTVGHIKHEIAKGVINTGAGLIGTGGNVVSGAVRGIGNGISDVSNTLKGFGGVLGVVGHAGGAVGNALGHVGGAINTVGGAIKGFGGKLGRIFGRRRRSLITKRSSEPTCVELRRDSTTACAVYAQSPYCPVCEFDPDTDCPGYADALAAVLAANADRQWLALATDSEYNVAEVDVDYSKLTALGAATGVSAKTELFGEKFDFVIPGEVAPFNVEDTGKAIAEETLKLFKIRAAEAQ